ncbi:hypothetical protein ACQW02_01215 [Humitalea sp. 24SJ18S-53]|uniref:hypothetical protein n=1 Tax=Humitalea sp. 24SJ18S-53 TaxID=3422307 RepID=UPI003D670EE5
MPQIALLQRGDATSGGSSDAAALPLGPFKVFEDGLVSPLTPGLAPRLRFAWRGQACHAALGDGLHLGADVGRLPSTASGADRAAVFAALPGLRVALPAGCRLRLLPDHRLRVETRAPLEAPSSAVSMVAAMVRFALALDPWLDEMEGCLVTEPSGRIHARA